MRVRSSRHGFTLVEVMALLLVVSIGLAAAVGAFVAGLAMSTKGRARSLALPTASMVAYDRQPLLDPELVPEWVATSYDFDDLTSVTATDRGQINGFFVVRNESTGPQDIIARSGAIVYARIVHVDVEVYESRSGAHMASFSTSFTRLRGTP